MTPPAILVDWGVEVTLPAIDYHVIPREQSDRGNLPAGTEIPYNLQ